MKRLLLVAALVACPALAAERETELGAVMPEYSRKVAEHRFKSGTDWEGTLKFYKNTYPSPQYARKAIINQPGIKAVHIANSSGKGGWQGLNISEANDEVRIFVVPNGGTGKRPRTK